MTDETLRIPRVTAPPTGAPVFVDASGRRRRLVRRAGWLLTVPAAGYLGLLASSMVGGPTLDAPFLPALPAHTADPAATAPAAPPAAATAAPATAVRTAGTATVPREAVTPPAARPTTAPPATAGPTATPGPTATGHGRPTAQPSRKPTKTP